MDLLKDFPIPILHITHKDADADSLAGVFWGVRTFGGCSLVHNPDTAARNLMKKLNFNPIPCKNFRVIFAYDVEKPERLPCIPDRLVVFDHHVKNSLECERKFWKPRASLSMNLYDLSKDAGIKLRDDVLLGFAAALVTDTAFLRTASSEELTYLGKFLGRRKLEEIMEIVLGGRIELSSFIADLMSIEVENGMCFGHFKNEDHFVFFVDSLMYALECNVCAGLLDWGVWVFAKKSCVQRVFQKLKKLEAMGYKRKVGKIYGLKDLELVKGILTS